VVRWPLRSYSIHRRITKLSSCMQHPVTTSCAKTLRATGPVFVLMPTCPISWCSLQQILSFAETLTNLHFHCGCFLTTKLSEPNYFSIYASFFWLVLNYVLFINFTHTKKIDIWHWGLDRSSGGDQHGKSAQRQSARNTCVVEALCLILRL